LLELSAQVLDAGGAANADAAQGRRAALLAVLRADLVRHCADPAMSVSALAQRHRISIRLVQQLFEEAGTTFTAELQQRRLDLVQRALRDPLRRQQKIATIAFDAGFSDLAAFNRLFRRQLGATPTELRRAAVQR
jgi:AraC-like DNA-binding protein